MSLALESSFTQLAIKLTLVLVGTWLAHGALSRCNPRWRVMVWQLAWVKPAKARRSESRLRLARLIRGAVAPVLCRDAFLITALTITTLSIGSIIVKPRVAIAAPPAATADDKVTSEKKTEGNATGDESPVRLESSREIAGIVRSPDGSPESGVQLTLSTAQRSVEYRSGYQLASGQQTVISDERGRFEFISVEEPFLITAVHETGYAELTGDELQGDVQLQPWAKVDVVVRRGQQAVAGAIVYLNPISPKRREVAVSSYGIEGETDAQGRVTFDRVVPRDATIFRILRRTVGDYTMNEIERSAVASLNPGAKLEVQLGGLGSTVSGKLMLEGEPLAPHQWNLNELLSITGIRTDNLDEQTATYRCRINDDGSFRIDDVAPGKYRLRVRLTAVPEPRQPVGAMLGMIEQEFEVSQNRIDADLGLIKGTWLRRLGAGDHAPLFVAAGLGRAPVKLSEYRGFLLLINFWTTTSPVAMTEMPKLVTFHEEFASDCRFQMVAISLDQTREISQLVVEQNRWPWISTFGGPQSLIASRFEVQAVPENFLIDLDGQIIYRGRDLDAIAKLVRNRLAASPAEVVPGTGPIGITATKIDDNFPAGQPIAVGMAIENVKYLPDSKATLEGPGLKLWDRSGQIVRDVEGVGTSRWLTGPRRLAVDPRRKWIYLCDTMNRRLIALDEFGRQLFSSDVPNLHSVAVDERTGDTWCLALSHLNQGELLVIDAAGREKTRHPISAYGLAYSPFDDAFWIVGKAIEKVSRDGQILSSQPLPAGGYTYTEVVVDRLRGGAWVLEDNRPNELHSHCQLWKVAPDGTSIVTHRLPKTIMPRALACVDGRLWLAAVKNAKSGPPPPAHKIEREILRFNLDGTPADTLPIPATKITVGVQTGAIWVHTTAGLLRVDADGTKLQTIPLRSDDKTVELVAF